MVNYKFESVQMLKSSVSELEVAQKLADIRMQLSEASLEMKSVDAILDSITLAQDIIHNYKGEDDQIIGLINCGGAMESLLGVAEKDITVAAAKEGLGEALGAAWKKIEEFVKWLVQKIKDFFVWIGKKLGLVKDKVESTKKEFEELPKDKKDAIEEACKKITVETGKPCTLTAQQIREQLAGIWGLKPDSKGTLRVAAQFALENFKVDQRELFTPRNFFTRMMAENIVSDLANMKSAIIGKMLRKSIFGPESPEKVISGLSSEGVDYLKRLGIKKDALEFVSHPDTRAKFLDDILKEVNSATFVLRLRRSGDESLSLVLDFKDGKEPKYIQETMYNLGYRSVESITSILDKLSRCLILFKEFESSRDRIIGPLEKIEQGVIKNAETSDAARSAIGIVRGLAEMYKAFFNAVILVENDGLRVANDLSETLSSLLAVRRLTTGE